MKSNSQDVAGAFAIARGNDPIDVKRAGVAFAIARGNVPVTTKYAKSEVWSINKEFATDAVNGSAVNENQSAKFGWRISMRSRLNIMQGERRGIQVNQPNANQDEELPERSSAFMRPYNGHGGAEDDDDEPVFLSVNGGAPMQLTYPKCAIAHLNDCTQRLCYPTKPGSMAQPESVTSGLTTTSSLASAIEVMYSSSLAQTLVRQPTAESVQTCSR